MHVWVISLRQVLWMKFSREKYTFELFSSNFVINWIQGIDRSSFLRNAFLPRSFVKIEAVVPASFLFCSLERRSFSVPFSVPFLGHFLHDIFFLWKMFTKLVLRWHIFKLWLIFHKVYIKMQISRIIFKILKICWNFYLIFMQKEQRKRNETVPFCVPLILEAFVPASFLSDFRGTVPASFLKKRNAFRNAFL